MSPVKCLSLSLRFRFVIFLPATVFSLGVLFAIEPKTENKLPSPFEKLLSLHTSLGKPKMGDWLAEHKEDGQTYRQYLDSHPIRVEKNRRTIYIQPLGELTKTQRKIVDLTGQFMGEYFTLPVKIVDPLPLSKIPHEARRDRKDLSEGEEQILTTYVLNDLLKPQVPKDASTLIAITPCDLWPGEGWNFVFGQASLRDRVGVWSFHRFGNPEESDEAFRLCLLRTIKVATHETGHMFSMQHCIQLECNMNGSNSLPESDRHPLEVCPNCLAKLCYATGAKPIPRFEKLIEFCKSNGLKQEQEFYERSAKNLR
jgi:archaemetzincin